MSVAECGWKCDICRKEYDCDETPSTDCNLSDMPVEIFQAQFPGHRPKKGRNTIICYHCDGGEKGMS